MSDPARDIRYFHRLEQTAFMKLEHAASLKGLLKPFKGKGDLESWANHCFAMRDELIGLAQRQVLQQVVGHPFHLLPIELAQQTTGAGTAFLRWRKHDRSVMGVTLWQQLMASTGTPVNLLADLHGLLVAKGLLRLFHEDLAELDVEAEADAAGIGRAGLVPRAARLRVTRG